MKRVATVGAERGPTSMIVIRKAELTDLPALATLYKELAATFISAGPGHAATDKTVPMRVGYYHDIISQKAEGLLLVAEEDGDVVGLIMCEYKMADEAFVWRKMVMIQDLYILPSFRERGIARELCNEALAMCKSEGCEIVYIWIASGNKVMEDQSDAWGFQKEYTIKTKLL